MNNKPAETLVLDTSCFFLDLPLEGNLYTTPGVVEELKDLRSRARLEVLIERGLTIRSPLRESLDAILCRSDRSGDRTVLSGTDCEVLALAREISAIVLSDDFALQNTAHESGIPVRSILQKTAQKRQWKIRCSGCGRYVRTMPKDETCIVCGSPMKRKLK